MTTATSSESSAAASNYYGASPLIRCTQCCTSNSDSDCQVMRLAWTLQIEAQPRSKKCGDALQFFCDEWLEDEHESR